MFILFILLLISASIKVLVVKNWTADDRERLYEKYVLVIFDMCGHYENMYRKMEEDRGIVKAELLRDYLHGSKV